MAKFIAAGVVTSITGWMGYRHFTPFSTYTRIVDVSPRYSIDTGLGTISSYQATDHNGKSYKIGCSPLTNQDHVKKLRDDISLYSVICEDHMVLCGYGLRNEFLGLKPTITDIRNSASWKAEI